MAYKVGVAWCELSVLEPPPHKCPLCPCRPIPPHHAQDVLTVNTFTVSSQLPYHITNENAAILQQPSLVIELEHQSSYEEDDAVQSLIRVFHHLCSTQIYLGSFKPHTDHIVSTTLHVAAALDNIMDLLHDHNFHQYVIALPPNNITLAHIFHPIYCTMTAIKQNTYEESDLRLVNHLLSPPRLPVPPPRAPSPTASTPTSSPLSTATTLVDESTDS